MPVDAGYTYTGLTPGEQYTLVAVVKRVSAKSPAVAATADGVTLGNPIVAIGSWEHTRVLFTASAGTQTVGITRGDSTDSGRVLIGGMTLVQGAYLGDYFPTISQLRDYSYVGGSRSGASREIIGTSTPSTLTSEAIDAVSGAVILSMDLRSELGAQIAVKIVAAEDSTLLAQQVVTLGSEWARYAVPSSFGRRVRIVLEASGSYDIDNVLLEGGSLALPFFSPEDETEADYETRWLGLPHRSATRRRWLGRYTTERQDSDWRPFFTVLAGTARGVRLESTQYEPVDPSVCVEDYERHYHDVAAISGPTTIADVPLTHGAAREVEFLLEATSPFVYGAIKQVIRNPATALPSRGFDDAPEVVFTANPLIDPDCPPMPLPPRAPTIIDACAEDEVGSWVRHWVEIPADRVSAWAATVPLVTLTTSNEAIRQVRVRVHPNPFGWAADEIDPNGYCSEFIVSYLPPNSSVTLDGRLNRASAQVGGAAPVPASHLLYGTGGTPMSWPELSCGIPYVLTIDTPPTQNDNLAIELSLARRE